MILTTAGKFCKTRLHKVLWRFLLGRISLYFGRYPNEMISAKYFFVRVYLNGMDASSSFDVTIDVMIFIRFYTSSHGDRGDQAPV